MENKNKKKPGRKSIEAQVRNKKLTIAITQDAFNHLENVQAKTGLSKVDILLKGIKLVEAQS